MPESESAPPIETIPSEMPTRPGGTGSDCSGVAYRGADWRHCGALRRRKHATAPRTEPAADVWHDSGAGTGDAGTGWRWDCGSEGFRFALFGVVECSFRGIALDLGIACVFWIWLADDPGVDRRGVGRGGVCGDASARAHTCGQPIEPSSEQKENVRILAQLAPASGVEVACWVLLCCLAGTIEETVFRGYLQRQFTAWTKGGVVWGVVFSAILFGAAHGYQGTRNMVLLAVFGGLFSVLAILRRGLRAGIFAHSWHDLIAGLTLAFLRAHRLL